MAFMSFEPFLYARCDLRYFMLHSLKMTKTGKYSLYELETITNEKKENFHYTTLNKELFEKGDEVVITNLKDKIILFKNFTKNSNNFKEAKLRHMLFMLMLFCMSVIFGVFCVKNGFLGIDIAFFMFFFLGFVSLLINFALLKKQIRILNTTSKDEFKEFITKD